MNPFDVPGRLVRNPLGIIALFISLIYAMGALLLGTTVAHLTPASQTALVVFLVVFPFVVLFSFCWLVSCHHKKLYAPGDYRSDKGFLSTFELVSPSEVGVKAVAEALGDAADNSVVGEGHATLSGIRASGVGEVTSPSSSASSLGRASAVFLLETLALEEIQREFNKPVMRRVRMVRGNTSIEPDGALDMSGVPTLIEVKRLGHGFLRRVREARDVAEKYLRFLDETTLSEGKVIVVFLADDEVAEPATAAVEKFLSDSEYAGRVSTRIYRDAELLKKYGFPSARD